MLPGVAAGFLRSGLALGALLLGGMATGLAVALLAGLVARLTPLREDASFAAFYLISLALGVLLVSVRGSNMDLLHVLFGTVLGLDDAARSEEHTSELQSLMRISAAVFCLKQKTSLNARETTIRT